MLAQFEEKSQPTWLQYVFSFLSARRTCVLIVTADLSRFAPCPPSGWLLTIIKLSLSLYVSFLTTATAIDPLGRRRVLRADLIAAKGSPSV